MINKFFLSSLSYHRKSAPTNITFFGYIFLYQEQRCIFFFRFLKYNNRDDGFQFEIVWWIITRTQWKRSDFFETNSKNRIASFFGIWTGMQKTGLKTTLPFCRFLLLRGINKLISKKTDGIVLFFPCWILLFIIVWKVFIWENSARLWCLLFFLRPARYLVSKCIEPDQLFFTYPIRNSGTLQKLSDCPDWITKRYFRNLKLF